MEIEELTGRSHAKAQSRKGLASGEGFSTHSRSISSEVILVEPMGALLDEEFDRLDGHGILCGFAPLRGHHQGAEEAGFGDRQR